MKKIMLVCAAGMSTSLLVTKMEKAAAAMGDEVEIFALPISEGEKRRRHIHKHSCIRLPWRGKQMRQRQKRSLRCDGENGHLQK